MKTTAVISAMLMLLLPSCAGRSMPCYEPQQYPDLNEEKLTLKKTTKKDSFIDLLKTSGATNIITSEGYVSGKVVSAVTADFLDYIYLFREGSYAGRVKIKHDEGKPQVHPFVKVVHGKNLFGVLLAAENIRIADKRIAQLIIVEKGGKISHKNISVESLIERHNGMYDPFVGGEDLGSGLILCARDKGGKAWGVVYHLTLEKGKVGMKPKPVNFAYSCSCFTDWLEGTDGREVFGMKVR